jgi:hypothetical protein
MKHGVGRSINCRSSRAKTSRTFLGAQLKIGQQLVELYQTQASNSTDTGLASFSITTLVQLQQHFGTAQQLGARYGLSADTVRQE